MRTQNPASLLKWAGGKEQELKYILPLLPPFQRYYEPFVGAGAVFFAIQSQQHFINDKSTELIDLYSLVAEHNPQFFLTLRSLHDGWQRLSQFVDRRAADLLNLYATCLMRGHAESEIGACIALFVVQQSSAFSSIFSHLLAEHTENFLREIQRNLASKVRRMRQLENKKGCLCERDVVANLESALKSAFYMHLRGLSNHVNAYGIPRATASAIFYFVREHAYASMFRYNSQGAFNVPYGGISYNRKDLARKIAFLESTQVQRHLANTSIENLDFEDFLLKHAPQANDFIFLDPPYDSEFSTYTRNEFSKQDQQRLAHYLLHDCQARFMLVIKNTPLILELYGQANLTIKAFDKTYLVSFQDRNNRAAEHLLITNY